MMMMSSAEAVEACTVDSVVPGACLPCARCCLSKSPHHPICLPSSLVSPHLPIMRAPRHESEPSPPQHVGISIAVYSRFGIESIQPAASVAVRCTTKTDDAHIDLIETKHASLPRCVSYSRLARSTQVYWVYISVAMKNWT
jgi:hypothetical protein